METILDDKEASFALNELYQLRENTNLFIVAVRVEYLP